MRYVEVQGLKLSRIGLGTWQFGSREWGYGADYHDREAGAILDRALDLGVTLVDTAEFYGFGRSERIIGRALDGRRGKAVLASKLFPVMPVEPVVGWRARASARRLGVRRIDLYQLHWPNPVVPLRITMRALGRLQRHGVIDQIGVSNFSSTQWAAADRALRGPVATNQVSYSLLDRAAETAVLPYAAAHGRVVIAYSPLAQGLLTGKYGAGKTPPSGMRRLDRRFRHDQLGPLVSTLREVGDAHDATPAQVALAWATRSPDVVAIPGASSVEQLESNAAAGQIDLSDDEADALVRAADAFGSALHAPPSERHNRG